MVLYNNDRRLKNNLLLSSFVLSLFFIIVFVLAYFLTVDIVASVVPVESGGFFEVWLPPVLISLTAAILCCSTMFLFLNKLIVPIAFLFLMLYYVLFWVIIQIIYSGSSEESAILTRIISIYMLPPLLIGNFITFSSYMLIFKKVK